MTIGAQITSGVRTRDAGERAEFEAVIGIEHVHDERPVLQEFTGPYDNRGRPRFTTSYVLRPASTEEVQEIVRIASRHTVSLWTGSQGRNNGYGGSADRVDGSVVLNLRRMNRVLEVNEKFSYVVVEPGVSFVELDAYLVDNG